MQPFKIGEQQHEAFREDAERRYVASVAEFLTKNVPEAAADKPEVLNVFVAAMVKKAKGYGMNSQRDAAVYVTTSYLLGENFEEYLRDARQVLGSSLPPQDKAEWLQQATVLLFVQAERKQK